MAHFNFFVFSSF